MNRVRRRLIGALAGAAVVPVLGEAAEPKPKRIVWYSAAGEPRRKRIRQVIAAKGIVEGRDIALGLSGWPGSWEKVQELIEGLARDPPDIVVVQGGVVVAALQERLRGTPVVFYNLVPDPVKLGLVASLSRPGGNMTGTTNAAYYVMGRCWQLLKEFAPSMKRGGFLEGKGERDEFVARYPRWADANRAGWAEANQHAAARLGIDIVPLSIPGNASADEIGINIRRANVQAVYFNQGNLGNQTATVARVLTSSKIPSMTASFAGARDGTLLGWSFDWNEGEDYAVTIVQRILQGESPAVIPVYQTMTYALAVNRKTARALGVEIPPAVMVQAREVFD